jgi:hypothetical protein
MNITAGRGLAKVRYAPIEPARSDIGNAGHDSGKLDKYGRAAS